jgi:hypothetical protein
MAATRATRKGHSFRGIFVAMTALFTSACGISGKVMLQQGPSISAADIQQVGPVRVLMRPQAEVEFMCRLRARQEARPVGRVLGCYIPNETTIISTPDANVLLHEFRHYFEGPFHD